MERLRDSNERADQSARLAAWVFAGVIAIAVPVILYQGRDQWFFLDDWDFLANRSVTDVSGLFEPHVQHWTTLPILVYRALWWLVGLRHYWPYQLCVVALHLGAAVLLWKIMRRALVRPWIATAAASVFAVFGAGRQDVVVAFQICFTGALTFGLAHLLLADHEGQWDRRDVVGVAFGLAALMCSAVGITMLLAVGMATLLRRGWKVALAHTAPLAGVFVLWTATFGRDSQGGRKAGLGDVTRFVWDAVSNALAGIGQLPGMALVFAAVVVVGLALVWSQTDWFGIRRLYGPTIGLAFAAFCFAATAGYGRAAATALGPAPASASRYVHIIGALCLPLIALSASAIVDRWRVAYPAAIAVFLVGVPGNIADLHATGADVFSRGDPELVLTMAHSPIAREVPRSSRPLSAPQADFTVGWLLDGVASGRIPAPSATSAQTRAQAELLLSVSQSTVPSSGTCSEIAPDTPLHVERGDHIEFGGGTVIVRRVVDGRPIASKVYGPAQGRYLDIVAGPLDLVVQTNSSAPAALHCR
jgi:hypothetical protein